MTTYYPLTLIAADGRRETVEALMDSGATFSNLPRSLLEGPGVRPTREVRMRLANGRIQQEQLGRTLVELDDVEEVTLVTFGGESSPPSIGAITLESFLLGVDPVARRLVPVEGWRA